MLQRIDVFYDKEEKQRAEAEHDAPGEEDPEHASDEQEAHSEPWKRPFIDHAFSVAVWDSMRQHDDIIVGANRPGRCDLTLEGVLLLPEEPLEEPMQPNKDRGKESARRQAALSPPPGASAELVYQPRVHVAQKRLWNELTGHDVDKTKLPFSEWQLLLCIVAAGPKGILQAEAGKETGQDKRSVPRRTDFLFQKGYIDKKQVLAHSQKTSLLTHKLYLETKQVNDDLPDPSKLLPQVLTQDLMPVPGHEYWTGAFVDTEMVARAAVAIIRAWGVIRRAHILAKMNISDLRMRKTLERTMRKFFELKIAKRVSAVTPDNPKIFKDCVKYLREPTDEEWSHFKKKLTSQGFKNRPSRAKPKSEHKPRVRMLASAPAGKRKKTVLDDSSDNGGMTEEGDGSDGSGDDNDDFFGADEQDEGFDAAAKPAQMTSTKETREELEAMVEEAIGAIPGGITEEDLLIELSGIAAEDVHSMFEPLNDSSPDLADVRSIHLVQEAIFRRGQETFQYYTVTDFKRRAKAEESVWEGVAVWRPEASHASTAHNVNNAQSFETQFQPTNAAAVSTPQPSFTPVPYQAIANPVSTAGTPASRPKPQTRRGRLAHTGTPSIRLNSPIKNQIGRPKRAGEEKVSFTSHDQVQREAGIPGVYWDIPEFTIKIKGPPLFLRGRKPKKFLVLFKTNRMNELDLSPKEHKPHIPLDFTRDDSANSTPEPQPFELGTHTMPTAPMGSPNVDISTPAETPHKSFIDLIDAPGAGYDSPYRASPATDSMAKPIRVASSIKKKYGKQHAANKKQSKEVPKVDFFDFVVTATPAQGMASDDQAHQAHQSPYPTQNSQSAKRCSSGRASKIAAERLHAAAESYQSPYTPPTSGDHGVEEAAAGEEIATEDSPSTVENAETQEEAAELGTKPKHVHHSAPLSEEQKYLDSKIQGAADEIFPGKAAQLPVIKDDIVGNLCTDMESTKVVFFPLDIMDMDHKMELDANLLSRADLGEEKFKLTLIMPNKDKEAARDTARKSANVETDDFDDEKIIFLFASTMLKKARGLKGKITWGIAARALQARRDALPSWSFPVPDGGAKPFKCDTCTGSWKNYEGIKYHKTKGKAACNPDYVRPPTPPRGERRTKRKGYVDVDLLPPEEAAQVAARLRQSNRSEEKVIQDSIIDEERRPKRRAAEVARGQSKQFPSITRREPSDSEESDYQDESVAKSAHEKAVSKDKTAKPMVNVAGVEVSIPNAKAVDAATPEKRVLLAAKRNLKYPTTNDRDNVDRRTGPVITQQRKDIIMELVEANGGSFPGDQGLWFAMHNAWMERYPGSNIQDYKYCNQAVALLEDQSLLAKLKFSFKDGKSRTRTRAVVTKMGVDPLSPEVTAIKEKIKEKFPKYYCPPEFAPSEETMSMLEARESRPSEEERQRRMAERELLQPPKANATPVQLEHDESFHPRKPSVPGQSAIRRRRVSTSSDEEIAFLNAPYYAPDPDGRAASEEERTILRRSRKPRQPKAEKTYHRSASFREGQSMRMKALWASMKERGSMLRDIHTNEELFLAENALVIEESGDESGHNDELMDTCTSAWTVSSSHAAVQSADGSWGMQPVSSIVKTKPVNHFTLLPEPVTYMQKLDNPFWCYRPFGHGVKPIYARPSKRLTTLHETNDSNTSFRPVIVSTRRLYGADQRRKDSNEARGTKRVRAWIHNEGDQKKKGRYIDRPQLEGGMHPYGLNPENGEEIPWPDFTPLILPLNRAKRMGPIMPEWSTNPGLDTLVNHFKASTRPAVQPESDGDIVMEESPASEVFPRSSAAFKDSLPIDLEAILTLATTDEYCIVEPDDDKLVYEIDAVGAWERSIKGKTLLTIGSVEAGTIFVNHTLTVDTGQSIVPMPCLPENQFTLETLPYGLLTYDPMEKLYLPAERAKRTYQRRAPKPDRAMHFLGMQEATASDFEDMAAQNGRKHRLADTYRNAEQQRVKRVYRRAAQTKDFKTRRLTCLPMDIEGLPLPADDPNFAVAVSHHDLSGHRKRTNERNVISDANDDRLIVTVIVIRTLLGGLDQSVDWVLVSKMFPQTTMNWLHRHFNVLADKHAKRVEKLVDDFQSLYLKAYAAGELPPLDYDNVLDYDWDALVEWTMDRTQAMATSNVNLPATREKFDLNFGIADAEERIFRDSFFNPALPVHKRIANATAKNNTLPLTPPAEPLIEPKEATYRIARSWTRAASLTPEATFDAGFTDAKLRMFPDELMSDVILQLMEGKVLVSANKGRQVPGRGFEATDVFAAAFSRLLSRAHYEEAADFKKRLDYAFRNGRTLTLEYTASEGEIKAVTNLAAHGRVVLTGEGVPNDEFGLTGGHYQTRIMDKRKLDFKIVIRSSPSYIYDTDHPMTVSGALNPTKNPPPRPLDEAIPLWYDINWHIIPDLWQKSVCMVLATIMTRTGIDAKEVTRLCRPALEMWEVKLLIDWACKVSAVREMSPGSGIEAWTVNEWWWWIGGQV